MTYYYLDSLAIPPHPIRLQRQLAKKVTTKDSISMIKNVCVVDVSYNGNIAYCSAVIIKQKSHFIGLI